MNRTSERWATVDPAAVSDSLVLEWETRPARTSAAQLDVGHSLVDQHALSDGRDLSAILRRFADHWCAMLSRPSFGQVHGGSPMETTRIVPATRSEAVDALSRSATITWGRGRSAGELRLGPFSAAPTELGRPQIAHATLNSRRLRRLRVSVAVFRHGNERCGIQIRPGYSRPWSSRRLRRCLRSTHSAADRLREIVLAVDFTPPQHARF